MILKGNQRGGGRQLARHLLNAQDNEHVVLHQLRGFVAGDLPSALHEAYALSRGTRARQYLFSLSLNPPPQANVATSAFEAAIETIEHKLGLTNQPRAIVFHEKHGRRHAHAVWSRIKTSTMTAIPLPYSKRRLMDVAKALYAEHGWDMPVGFTDSTKADPATYTQAEAQQAQRAGRDPKVLKQRIQEWWSSAPTAPAFVAALQAHGFILARGDRRGHVVIDPMGEVYALARVLGLRAKEIAAKLGNPDHLPTVEQAHRDLAARVRQRGDGPTVSVAAAPTLTESVEPDQRTQHLALVAQRKAVIERQRRERAALEEAQAKRWVQEARERAQRFRSGLRGLWDRATGKHARIVRQNEQEATAAKQRDQAERDRLVFAQLEERRGLHRQIKLLHLEKALQQLEPSRGFLQQSENNHAR